LIGAFWIVAQPHKAAAHQITQARRQSRIVNAITGPTSPSCTKLLNYDDFETLILVKAKYELLFDLKTAKTLGLKIPQSPPMFAEDVIE
jgi:hypothetical protein